MQSTINADVGDGLWLDLPHSPRLLIMLYWKVRSLQDDLRSLTSTRPRKGNLSSLRSLGRLAARPTPAKLTKITRQTDGFMVCNGMCTCINGGYKPARRLVAEGATL